MWPIGQYLDVKAAGGVHYHSYSVRCAVHTKTQKTETIRGPRRYSSDLWLWSTGQKLEQALNGPNTFTKTFTSYNADAIVRFLNARAGKVYGAIIGT